MENFSYFDIIILALIALLGLKGLLRGLVQELFAIFGIIGGIFIASRIASSVGGLINVIVGIKNENTMIFVGFLVSLIFIWSAAYLSGSFFSKLFSATGLGIFDKVFGFVFGAGKVFLLFSIIVFALSSVEMMSKKMDNLRKTSFMYPMLVSSGGYIIKLNNENIKNTISTKIDTAVDGTKTTINKISDDVVNKKLTNLKTEKK
ncbi:MAG: CvpA family protein [Arcobacter sp.]|nr:CvpA family protein [Arcobacter sp.]